MIRDDSPTSEGDGLADMPQRIRLIDSSGKQLGIMTLSEAKAIADSSGAKLWKFAPTASPAIYRLVEKGSKYWGKVEKPRWILDE